jgi:nanoRNase/pAp phosphatase (c-di-AMP/oligoRNAs hydrolase)
VKYVTDIDNIDKYNIVYFLDTGGIGVLGEIGRKILDSNLIKIIIDHHHVEEEFINKFDIILSNPDASSTIEIILNILAKYIPISYIDRRYFTGILTTIYVETRFLTLASSDALYWFMKFRRITGIDVDEVRRIVSYQPDISERIAVLKALKRMQIYRYNDRLLSLTEVSAYMNQASAHLSRIGADIVIIYSGKKRDCRIHIRIGDSILKRYNIDLYEFLKKFYSGDERVSYGGHIGLINIEFKGGTCSKFIEEFISGLLKFLKDRYNLAFSQLK